MDYLPSSALANHAQKSVGNGRRILVTGALGYLGKRVWQRLCQDGWHPIAIIRAGSEQRAREQCIAPDDFHILPSDANQWPEFLTDLKPDAAIHLAAVNLPGTFIQQNLMDMQLTHIHLPLCLSQAILRTAAIRNSVEESKKSPCLLLAGSHWQRVNGQEHCPLDIYAASKQAAEEMLHTVAMNESIRIVSLRLADVYGPDDRRKKFLNLLVDALRQDQLLPASPGLQGIDLVHVQDVVNAFVCSLHANKLGHGGIAYFGVGSGTYINLRQLVERIDRLSVRPCRIEWGALPYRAREVLQPNPGQFLPGWMPTVSLTQGLQEILAAAGLL